jgi:hypothetical protein
LSGRSTATTIIQSRSYTKVGWPHLSIHVPGETNPRSRPTTASGAVMKDRIGDQRGGSEWEPIKILLQRTRPMSQSQLQWSHTNTSRQDNIVMDQLQFLGTIPRRTCESTRREAMEPNKLGKILRTDRTIRLAAAGCPPGKGRTVRKTGADRPQYKRRLQPKNTTSV